MSADVSDRACEILRATADGNDLAPPDLKLLELAVNGMLNEVGKEAFMELHRNATKPQGYTAPWFLGIEHMQADADALAVRCRALETQGIVPTPQNTSDWAS
jgi:hypothetical protein